VSTPTTRFATFALLYMTALYLEMAEHWHYPVVTATVLVIACLLVATGITRARFLGFLAVITAHFLLVQFPDVANHVNVAIYANVMMMTGIGYSLARRSRYPTDEDAFELLRPLLQVSMILVYALAGFHKLNRDFFDPAVSCVRDLMGDLIHMFGSRVVGVPTRLVLLVGILVLAQAVLSARWGSRPGPVARAAAFGGVLVAAVLAYAIVSALPVSALTAAVVAMSVLVILWELVGGLLLAVPRLQAPLLAFSWSMHATLALIGFVDFGAFALAMLYTFVPQTHGDLLTVPVELPGGPRRVSRPGLYFGMCVLAGLAAGLDRRLLGAILFEVAAMVLIWPMLASALRRGQRPAWSGARIAGARTPAWLFGFPVLLVLHGFTSYLGLRTAGNFSMFSNLRTEGPVSNHLLLRSSPLKLWSYQEDVVRFIDIDDRQARIGYQYQPLRGQALPAVEFRKLIREWTRAGATVPMRFEYRGQVYATDNIVRDPEWRFRGTDWEMRLLDFRVIQPEGPNTCRW
jgi:hypothetical protein